MHACCIILKTLLSLRNCYAKVARPVIPGKTEMRGWLSTGTHLKHWFRFYRTTNGILLPPACHCSSLYLLRVGGPMETAGAAARRGTGRDITYTYTPHPAHELFHEWNLIEELAQGERESSTGSRLHQHCLNSLTFF